MAKLVEAESKEGAKVLVKAILSDLETTIDGSPEIAALMINSSLAAVEVLIHRYGIRKDFIKETYDSGWQQTVDKLINEPSLYHQK